MWCPRCISYMLRRCKAHIEPIPAPQLGQDGRLVCQMVGEVALSHWRGVKISVVMYQARLQANTVHDCYWRRLSSR